jgi:two-component system response regulator ResD
MSQTDYKILIVDDEERIRRLLRLYLEKEKFVVDEAEDGEAALKLALENVYDIILLDIMMPGMDGIEVCAKIRVHKSTPIIMLTAKGEEANRVQGFEAGADDYVTKPFSPREIVLRTKAVIRRSSTTAYFEQDTQSTNSITFPHLTIEHDAHRVLVDEEEIILTPKEYELLHYLASTPDKVFSREDLLKDVWNYDYFGDLRTVDTHVKRLREKLNKVSPEAGIMIATVWGVGYKFEVPR